MSEHSNAQLRVYRLLFNVALAVWFYAIGFWLGPNELTFHKIQGLTTADFVPIVQKYCVPVVRQMKMYQREHGQLPQSPDDVGPIFSNHRDTGPGFQEMDQNGNYTYGGPGPIMFKHTITYDFRLGYEGWSIQGPYVNGPLPLPPVVLEPEVTPVPRK